MWLSVGYSEAAPEFWARVLGQNFGNSFELGVCVRGYMGLAILILLQH